MLHSLFIKTWAKLQRQIGAFYLGDMECDLTWPWLMYCKLGPLMQSNLCQPFNKFKPSTQPDLEGLDQTPWWNSSKPPSRWTRCSHSWVHPHFFPRIHTYVWHIYPTNDPNVGKYSKDGAYGKYQEWHRSNSLNSNTWQTNSEKHTAAFRSSEVGPLERKFWILAWSQFRSGPLPSLNQRVQQERGQHLPTGMSNPKSGLQILASGLFMELLQ